MHAISPIHALAAANQRRAREIIRTLRIEAIWREAGARINLVGSLRTGLLMARRDIDFPIYSPCLGLAESFAAIERLAGNSGIRRIITVKPTVKACSNGA